MAKERDIYPLIEAQFKRLRLPWYVLTTIVAVFLFLFLILIAYIDGVFTQEFEWNFWRVGLQGPVLIIYILAVYPVMKRVGNDAIETTISLLALEQNSKKQASIMNLMPIRRSEWISLFIGAAFIILLSQPWRGIDGWFEVYILVNEVIMFSLLALLIYYGLRDSRYITQLNRNLDLDIFNIEALVPMARRSLSVSLAFIGGIVISVAFQTVENLMQWPIILIYAILIGATILIFFMSMWSIHAAITRIKSRELSFVSKNLMEASRKLKQQATRSPTEVSDRTYYEVAAWGLYEQQIMKIREWPYNTAIINRLILSAISPVIVYIMRVILGARFTF